MKTCNRFKDLMVDAFYEELAQEERRFFHSHLDNCSHCSAEYQELTSAMNVMDRREPPEMSEEFWDNFRPNLQLKINEMEAERRSFSTDASSSRLRQWWRNFNFKWDARWLLYPAAAMLVVVSGIVIGRYIYSPVTTDYKGGTTFAVNSANPAVADHLEELRPMLVDYSNYSPQDMEQGADQILVDRDELQQLILRNKLLKKMVERGKDANTKQLLEDLEMILLELSNSGKNSDRKDTLQTVQEMLKENNVLFKMNVANKRRASL